MIFILSLLRCADAFYDPLWIFPAIFYFSMGFYAVKHIQKAMKFLDSLSWKDFISAYILFAAVSVYSFWIYAAHAPFVVTEIKKIIIKLIPMNGGFVLVQFFLTAFLCIVFLMTFGILLRHKLPKIFALVTGSRIIRTS